MLSTLIIAVATIAQMVIQIYMWVVIISALISWVRPDPYNPIIQILQRLTEPVYEKIRKYIPTVISGIDLTPVILILILQFINLFFIQILFDFAYSIK